MKEIKIKYVIKNSENEIIEKETIGTYNEKNNEICYQEEDLKVNVLIEKEKVIMVRKTNDYTINFDFQLNTVTKNKYKLKSLGVYVDIEIETKRMYIGKNYINIWYTLINNEQPMGEFEYDLYWE